MARRAAGQLVPEPERASETIIARCRAEVEGRAKQIVREVLRPWLRRRYRLAELGEGFHWARDGKMTFGDGSRIGRYAYVGTGFECEGPAVIGDLCMISAGCKVVGADHTFDTVGTPTRLGFPAEARPATIFGVDSWIGRNVLIMEGVRIGAGAIVGSGALVTRDVQPYTIVGGVPAKVLRHRFPDEQVSQHDRALRSGADQG